MRKASHCLICGEPIIGNGRWKYCSATCGAKAKLTYLSGWNKEFTAKLRAQVRNLLGDKCKRCGITDIRVLQIDHINGNGYREKKEMGWSSGNVVPYYRHILDVKGEGYQLLCANCNWIKRYEQKEEN